MPAELPSCLANLDIEFNLPEKLDPADIDHIRWQTLLEVERILQANPHGDPDQEPTQTYPFGAPIIEQKDEMRPRVDAMAEQLRVALRYIDEMLALDQELCGNPEQGMGGIHLPILRAKQGRNRHKAVVKTRNAWGSEADNPDKSTDMPVLNEEDRVDIFDAEGEFLCGAVVRDVAGDTVQLHIHSDIRLRTGFSMCKKSNRPALTAYKRYIQTYCEKLWLMPVADQEGNPYNWGPTENEETDGPFWSLTTVEKAFFRTDTTLEGKCDIQRHMGQSRFSPQQIPRGIIDDPEQCTAFALGAMGHPCYLIQGPPGTGKTTVASHLAQYFHTHGMNTLILSHSNKGLDVLLRAIKKKKVPIHRGGTEVHVCDRELQENFIRRGLTYPRKSDFMEEKFDEQSYRAACDAQPTNPPNRANFILLQFNHPAWKEAWRVFDEQKQAIIQELKEEQGLVAGVTLNTLLTDEIIQALPFDVVIVDEASKGYLYELLPALEKAGKQIIFVGDHKQLGNVDIPSHLKQFMEDRNTANPALGHIGAKEVNDFADGPFGFMAERTGIPQVMLRTNRRSLPAIVELVSKAGYGGKLKAGRIDHEHPENIGELIWVDTSSHPDKEETASGFSKVNKLEARLLARRLYRDFCKGKLDAAGDFGAITMYRAQGKQVRRSVHNLQIDDSTERDKFLGCLSGNIATVDAFQGSQRERIYMATTRSNEQGAIGFLDNVRRVNVGCSRAQDALIIYGDRRTLVDENPDPESRAYFAAAYEACRKHGTIIDQYPSLPSQWEPDEKKKQTHSARRNRQRRAWRKQKKTDTH